MKLDIYVNSFNVCESDIDIDLFLSPNRIDRMNSDARFAVYGRFAPKIPSLREQTLSTALGLVDVIITGTLPIYTYGVIKIISEMCLL